MWTLPNILTMSRIVTIPLLVALLWWPDWRLGYALAWGLYCLMGITDYFDGYLARSSGAVSKLGQFLDPIADKLMIAAVILVLTAQGYLRGPYVGDLHVIAGLIILMRELAVSGLREFLGGLAGQRTGQQAGEMEDDPAIGGAGRADPGRRRAWTAMSVAVSRVPRRRGRMDPSGQPGQPVGRCDPHSHHRLGLSAGRHPTYGLRCHRGPSFEQGNAEPVARIVTDRNPHLPSDIRTIRRPG